MNLNSVCSRNALAAYTLTAFERASHSGRNLPPGAWFAMSNNGTSTRIVGASALSVDKSIARDQIINRAHVNLSNV